MEPSLTTEQTTILDSVSSPTPPPCLLISAGPGTGKTFIIVEAIKRRPAREHPLVYCLAFNKEIASELVRRLPPFCNVSTFNSLGLEAWASHIFPIQPKVDARKMRRLLREVADLDRWSIAPEETDDLLALASMAKNQGYAPPRSGAKSVHGCPSFRSLCALADIRPEPHFEGLLNELLTRSIKAAFQGDIDFDDQVYMTVLFVPTLPKPKWLFVDEAQDMNGLQLAFVGRLKAEHLVMVGDPLQAIYAFRGAMSDSFERIRARWPEALELPLNTSFRVPFVVLHVLQDHNPALRTQSTFQGMTSFVRASSSLDAIFMDYCSSALKTKAILCRNNAPLFRVALACIASGVPFAMANVQFGRGLIRDIKHLSGHLDTLVRRLTEKWDRPDLSPAERDRMRDKLAAIDAVAQECHSTGELISKIEGLLRQPNNSEAKGTHVLLSTAHRAKGLEFDWVMHLDPHLIPSPFAKTPEELSQEANIAYVINSRTKHTLVFCRSDQILIPAPAPRRMRPDIRKDQPL